MRIAITRSRPGKYELYGSWLRAADPEIELLSLEEERDATDVLATADGLLLPGGGDVDPDCFGMPEMREHCLGISARRDALEYLALGAALGRGLPILGICRGLQLVNVALGGTLLIDLPTAGIEGHGKIDDLDARHEVRIEGGSLLHTVIGETRGIVNSAHHQAAARIAPSLRATAWKGNGVVEGLEWNEQERRSPLLLVQWHPERMEDEESPFSASLAQRFLDDCALRAR
jgi:putative glutamine amidotransferase